MYKKLWIAILIALPLLSYGQVIDSLSYKNIEFQFSIAADKETSQPVEISIKTISFPDTMTGRLINQLINSKIYSYNDDSVGSNVYSFIGAFLENYGDFRKDFPDNPMSWSIDRKASIICNNNKILSIEFFEYVFEGGAHPSTTYTLMMLNPSDAKEISLEEILIPGSYDPLHKLCEKHLRINRNISTEQNLEDEGFWLEKGKLPLPENIALTSHGLRLLYNSYEIAPYAMGQSDFTIPYDELTKILKPEYLPSK